MNILNPYRNTNSNSIPGESGAKVGVGAKKGIGSVKSRAAYGIHEKEQVTLTLTSP
jgi:hypothetical protein